VAHNTGSYALTPRYVLEQAREQRAKKRQAARGAIMEKQPAKQKLESDLSPNRALELSISR